MPPSHQVAINRANPRIQALWSANPVSSHRSLLHPSADAMLGWKVSQSIQLKTVRHFRRCQSARLFLLHIKYVA